MQRSQIIPHVPPPKAFMYDDVFEHGEWDKVVCGGDGGEEGVTEVSFELDAEGGEDEEGFCELESGMGDGGMGDGKEREDGGRTVENLGAAGPDEPCQYDPDPDSND